MNRAVTGGSQSQQPGARENVAYLTSTERRRDFETQSAFEKREMDVSFTVTLQLHKHIFGFHAFMHL